MTMDAGKLNDLQELAITISDATARYKTLARELQLEADRQLTEAIERWLQMQTTSGTVVSNEEHNGSSNREYRDPRIVLQDAAVAAVNIYSLAADADARWRETRSLVERIRRIGLVDEDARLFSYQMATYRRITNAQGAMSGQ